MGTLLYNNLSWNKRILHCYIKRNMTKTHIVVSSTWIHKSYFLPMFRFLKIRKQKEVRYNFQKRNFILKRNIAPCLKAMMKMLLEKSFLPSSLSYTYVQTHERNKCWMARIIISTRFPFDKSVSSYQIDFCQTYSYFFMLT